MIHNIRLGIAYGISGSSKKGVLDTLTPLLTPLAEPEDEIVPAVEELAGAPRLGGLGGAGLAPGLMDELLEAGLLAIEINVADGVPRETGAGGAGLTLGFVIESLRN